MSGTTSVFADLVGRRAELQILRRAIDEAMAGHGSIVLLAGEPGIGKTRLAQEVAEYAGKAGMAVRLAAAWEGDGAPAYWPWIQLIRAHARHGGADDLIRELGPDADELVRLVPELAATVPGSAAGRERIGEQPRFRLFDAVASFLRRAALQQPLLLVLDDLHWSDVGSVMLLSFCSRELRDTPVLAVGALRDLEVDPGSEQGQALAVLQQRGHTLTLGGLEPGDVRELLGRFVGHHEAERMALDVHQRSGGNPLFVRELGRLLTTGRRGLGVGSIPQSIHAVIEGRVSRLSVDCVDLLRNAATMGEEFRVDVLERATAHSRERILELLDEAIRARLILQTGWAPTRFTFAHALVRDALYERLGLAQRAAAHLRIGEALEQLPAADPPYAELAHHFFRADLVTGDLRAVDYAERAGRESFDKLAYEDAAAHFARAIAGLGDGDDDRRARLLIALGEAHLWAGDVEGAREAFEEAAELARQLRRPDLLAAAALGFSAGLGGIEMRLFDRAQIDLLQEAIERLDSRDSPLVAQAMAMLSVALTYTDSPERRLQLAEEASAMARRLGDAKALVHALGAQCDATAGPDHSEERLARSSEMVTLARQIGDRRLELLGRRHRLVALLELGDVPRVDAEIDEFEATAESIRQPAYLWYVVMWRAMRALMEGRIDDVHRLNDEVTRIADKAHSDNGALLAEVLRWNCLREEGKYRETADVLREQLKLTAGTAAESFWVPLCVPSEHPEEAKAVLERLGAHDFTELPRDAVWLAGMCGVADACRVVGDDSSSERVYELLGPYANLFAVDGTGTACYGSIERYLGVLAGVLGRYRDAEEHFASALRENRRAGASLLVAHTLADHGSMLVGAGERERAHGLLLEASDTYRELGVVRQVERIETLLNREPGASEANAFRREGEFWTITYEGRTLRLKDAKGLRDIATLIEQQGREVHVADLIGAVRGGVIPSSADPVLDDQARAAYRARLDELREELEDAERFSDLARAERAREEMDAVAGELASALGLGGRGRRMSNPAERARKAVAQRVRNALHRIDAELPELARHLDRSLRMGSFCSYSPERPVEWRL